MDRDIPPQTPSLLFDERQRRIHRGLLLVGAAPAEAYLDALKLSSDPHGLTTASHLIFHLAREIEGHVRSVAESLGPDSAAEGPDRGSPTAAATTDAHDVSIERTASALGISSSDPILGEWRQVARFMKGRGAHRVHLSGWRTLGDEHVAWWDRFEAVMDIVLGSFQERFLQSRRVIDELLALGPSNATLRRLREEVPHNSVTLGHFFERAGPEWLSPLRSAGFFRFPPAPEVDDGGVRLPDWPHVDYLLKVAPDQPEEVAAIIHELPATSNTRVHQSLVSVLVQLSAEHAAGLVPVALGWLAGAQFQVGLAGRLTSLGVRLADAGFAEQAFLIAQATFNQGPTEEH